MIRCVRGRRSHRITGPRGPASQPGGPSPADSGGLTQPKATVAAAFVAVFGALIAYAGVIKTARSTRTEKRREERLAILTEASVAIVELSHEVAGVPLTDPSWRADTIKEMYAGPMRDLGHNITMAAAKLELYGLGASAKATNTLSSSELSAMWDRMRRNPAEPADVEQIMQKYDKAMAILQQDLKGLR